MHVYYFMLREMYFDKNMMDLKLFEFEMTYFISNYEIWKWSMQIFTTKIIGTISIHNDVQFVETKTVG